ncbi:unnamed protein product [Porites lobata]|uniref:Sushi, von Willebrand factor type A, EGF and pentraxin domain-containing protein 1-like n=1 Tax=Porites lobata TaxID=104759 RepID=A0ABN8N1D9_9CNID|nr:unnamed protein product [Porites lobata]
MLLLVFWFLLLSSSSTQSKRYTVIVKTSNEFGSGTDATVKIKIKGTRLNLAARELKGSFERRRPPEVFQFSDCDIGYVRGLDVYRGNQVADVDECKKPYTCISPAKCENTVGSYKCHCPKGYVLKPGTNNQCQDVNECLRRGPCDYRRSTCQNIPGDYRCNCKAGYRNKDAKTCININECTMGIDSCDKTSSDCIDSDGTFWCRCKKGYYQKVANNKLCVAVECGPLIPPASGTFEPARCIQVNSNVFRDKCHLKCHVGYAISDVSQGILTCGSRGRWEGTLATCQPVSCPKLPAFSNGGLLPSSCTSSGGKYPNKCSYYCSSGYSLQGGQFRQCQADGTWDRTAPTCTKILAKPWIRCPDHIIQDLLPGKSTADVSSVWKEPTSNVEPAQITISPPEISSSYQFPPGTTKVTWTASNVVGSQRCSSYVIIYDKEAPTVANCPQEILEISSGPKAVTWVEPTFRDNVKVTKIDTSHTNGSVFELGTTYVSYTAEDAARNTAFCKFKVQLKRLECYEPDGPEGGTKQCNEFGGSIFCTVTCHSGSQLYRETASYWQCNKGVWTPSDVIPDCVVSSILSLKDPNTACQENQFVMNITNVFGTNLYCAKCPTGTYKSSITDCNPCPAGSYNDQQGQLQCTLCPTGTSSLPGAKTALDCIAPCPAGQFSKTGLGPNCQYCPRDSYQDKVQQKSCTPCPHDTHTLSLGAKNHWLNVERGPK